MNRTSLIASFLLLAGLAPLASGEALYDARDNCVESSTDSVNLPVSVPYRMSLQSCPTCQVLDLQVDQSTRFYVGDQQVDLPTLRSYASRRVQQLNVCIATGTQRLTRIVLVARLDADTRLLPSRPAR
jgi:hypothetical protein